MEARRREREQELADARDARDAARLRMPPTVVRYERHSFAVNFIPFGAGQFQNGAAPQGVAVPRAPRRRWPRSRWARSRPISRSTASRRSAGAPSRSRWRAADARPASIDHSQEDTSRTLLARAGGQRRRCSSPSRSGASSTPSATIKPEVPLTGLGRQGRARAFAGRASHCFRPTASAPPGRSERKSVTMATLKFAGPRQGHEGLPHPQEDHVAGPQRRGGRDPSRPGAGRQPRAHPLRRPRLQPRDDGAGRRGVRQRAQEGPPQAAARGPHPHRQRRDRVLAVRPAGRRRRDRRQVGRAGVVQAALRVQPQADGQLRAARPCSTSCWTS